MKKSHHSIMYINFAPYENAGRILDFLIERYYIVVLFSFNFHKLNNQRNSNKIIIYQNGRIKKIIKLFRLPVPGALLFLSLPFIVLVIILQTCRYAFKLKRQYGAFDVFLSVNAFTAWLGNMLRSLRVVKKTVFWVWDYYPPGYPDWRIRLARWGYWHFDKLSSNVSTVTVFLNKRLIELRQEIGVLSKDRFYPIVPIGTNPRKPLYQPELIIGHFGVLKKSQGLDMLFDVLESLTQTLPTVRIEIIGSGPDEAHFKERARQYPQVTFYGFIKNEDEIDSLMQRWAIGVATYIPDKSSPASWTDPSKIKADLSQAVPVITTTASPFSEEIKQHKAGLVVEYADLNAFLKAIQTIIENQSKYQNSAAHLAALYDYRTIYNDLIFLEE